MKFQKGKSGNPGGRPKENIEVRELAREYTTEAIERLAYWMRSDNPKASGGASIALLERGWGKAVQPTEHSGKDGGPIEFNEIKVQLVSATGKRT